MASRKNRLIFLSPLYLPCGYRYITQKQMDDVVSYKSLLENYPSTEFFLVRIFLYSVRIQENTDQKKLRIWHFSHSELIRIQVTRPAGNDMIFLLPSRVFLLSCFFLLNTRILHLNDLIKIPRNTVKYSAAIYKYTVCKACIYTLLIFTPGHFRGILNLIFCFQRKPSNLQ